MNLQGGKKGEGMEQSELERGEKGRRRGEQRWISSRQHEGKLCLRLGAVRMHLCLCLRVELVCIQNLFTVKSVCVCVNCSISSSHPCENHSVILIN